MNFSQGADYILDDLNKTSDTLKPSIGQKLEDREPFDYNSQILPSSHTQSGTGDMVDGESTWVDSLQENGIHYSAKEREKQFDIIAMKVNKTIQEINLIYNEIGYCPSEISSKKADIFLAIEDTIANFTMNLQREKNSIENDCEWLRQQIRIILAMIDDQAGEKTLNLIERGIVYRNRVLFEQGFKDEIILKKAKEKESNFYDCSPFNLAESLISDIDITIEPSMNEIKKIPHFSLLQTKSNLNIIFLHALKVFVKCFKKLNELNIHYWEEAEVIGNIHLDHSTVDLVNMLPTKEEALMHRNYLEHFERCVKVLRLNDSKIKVSNMKSNGRNIDEVYVTSSPTKKNYTSSLVSFGNEISENVSEIDMNDSTQKMDNIKAYFREINYSIVRIIKSLKFTKITPEVLHVVQREIEALEAEANSRIIKVKETIQESLNIIEILHLSEEQIVELQKQYEDAKRIDKNGESYIDIEALSFISNNPKEFGLNNKHLEFLKRFLELLRKIKDNRQKRFDHYSGSCEELWRKLHEDQIYVEQFRASNLQLSDNSINNYKLELNRLLIKRSEYIDKFIFEAQQEIRVYWSKLYFTEDEKRKFTYYNNENYSSVADKEEILKEHEIELINLKDEYDSKAQILEQFEKLNELMKDQIFLRESSKDSSRLLSKNSCKILLNEEKLRKKVLKNMPKVLHQLKELIIAYNDQQVKLGKNPFFIEGQSLLDKITRIQAEQQNSGFFKNNKALSGATSPRTKSSSDRKSPVRRQRVPSYNSQERNFKDKPTAITSNSTKSSPGVLSPLKIQTSKHHIAKPQVKTNSYNTSHIKYSKALSNSATVQNNSTSSAGLESPERSSNSSTGVIKFFGTTLMPLNSPLKERTNLEYKGSDMEKLSPLSLRSFLSPERDNKENLDIRDDSAQSKADSIPTTIAQIHSRSNGSPSKFETDDFRNSKCCMSLDADSSTIVGDEYQLWREEKIRQLNSADV